ncbi:hypothetical protein A6X21_03950 [Planctopirus hydrillae]|uniref:Uncharacterized protein n=1 Tax=Planctopirus hydrillae TaxID=1841610 RepID=A0A1C3ENL5_9PLAN|nr:hypothetical protein A6X21_03950 [Planctopirus hydrillae]
MSRSVSRETSEDIEDNQASFTSNSGIQHVASSLQKEVLHLSRSTERESLQLFGLTRHRPADFAP